MKQQQIVILKKEMKKVNIDKKKDDLFLIAFLIITKVESQGLAK